MDNRTLIVIFSFFVMIGGVFWIVTSASVERTKLQTEASVAKAKEHTTRAEGRQSVVDFLGMFRK
jgi:hypothetical protein